jgi:hypothetical protein
MGRDMTPQEAMDQTIDPPPFLRTWRNLYIAVLVYLALLITALSLVGRWVNPAVD